jgi:hypothetical protein
MCLDSVARDHFHQFTREERYTEYYGGMHEVLQVASLQRTGTAQTIGGQIDDFLRRAGAFERQGRLREHRAAARFQSLDALPSIWRVLWRIVAAHAVLAQGRRQAPDLVPVQLHARTNDKVVVRKRVAGFEHDVVLVRVKCFDGSVDQSHTGGDKATFGPLGLGHVIGACADQCEARLVIVCFRRLNDGDV